MKRLLWIMKINNYTHDADVVNFSILETTKLKNFRDHQPMLFSTRCGVLAARTNSVVIVHNNNRQ